MVVNTKISDWVNAQIANGNYSFNTNFVRNSFDCKSDLAIKGALDRLVKQNKIISVSKQFYIIIPPSYQNMRVLPPILFIDQLMEHLQRPYYVSLLSAAALWGAAHQQPQSLYVCTNLPSLRNINKKGIKIKYISKRKFSDKLLTKKKTESGYITVAMPLLTCVDLIKHHKAIGGLNRAATVINELLEAVKPTDITTELLDIATKSDLQRLGYLCEFELEQHTLANKIFDLFAEKGIKKKNHKLLASKPTKEESTKNRWLINYNTKIEIDE